MTSLKTRIISFSLTASMALSMLPATAWAADSRSYSGTYEAHTTCGQAASVEVSTFDDLRTQLNRAEDLNVIIAGDIDVSGTVTVTGTKHIYAENGNTRTLTRTGTGAMFSVSSGATLILGSGTAEYDNTLSDSSDKTVQLAAAGQKGEYTITGETTAGQLILDGGAVWSQGSEYARGTNFSSSNGRQAVFYDLADPTSASYGKQYYYSNNTGIVAASSMITNAGTLDIWPGVTMQNAATTGVFGAAINTAVNGELNMYGGTITNCAAAGNMYDQGIGGAVYLGNANINWTTRGTPDSTIFNLYGGSVINNATPANSGGAFADGGGIAMDAAKMNMYGGSVSWNHAGVYYNGGAGDGGGIMVRCGSVLNMYSGSIDHNYAGGYGGGVVAWNADINIHGGSVTQNFASFGAGIGIASHSSVSSTVTMTGGTVAYNEAIEGGPNGGYGGGICAGAGTHTQGAHLILSGGTIQQNKALYGGGLAVYAGGNGSVSSATQNTDINLFGDFQLTGNSANFNGNGMYVKNTSTGNKHTLVTLSGNAKIDTNNPVYFENLCRGQTPVLVSGALTIPGTAAIFEFSDHFWSSASYSGYIGAPSSTTDDPLAIVQFANGLDIQENKIALESAGWYLKANDESNTLDLHNASSSALYTIRNGTPVTRGNREYYKLYSSLADAFKDAADDDVLYIFYNTTIATPAVLENDKHITLLAESTSSAGTAGMAAKGGDYSFSQKDGYYAMTGTFLLYQDGTLTPSSQTYNVRNDYTITLSSTLYLGLASKSSANMSSVREAAIIVNDGSILDVGQVSTPGMGAGSLVFDGNLSSPKEGPMFQNAGTLTFHDGITIKNHSNYSELHPGAVEVTDGTVTMNQGVTITGNVSPIAGAVFIHDGARFVMNGGTISDNTGAMPRYGFESTASGSAGSKFQGYDTAYWGQPKFYYGAGAVCNYGSFTMLNGTLSGNHGEHGGLSNLSGTLTLSGGSITGNHAHTGTGISGDPCDLTITAYTEGTSPSNDRVIAAPYAGSGGGLYLGTASTSVEIGGVTISNNTAEKNGGGIAAGPSINALRNISSYRTLTGAAETATSPTGAYGTSQTVSLPALVPNYSDSGTDGGTGNIDENSSLSIHISGSSITGNTAGELGGGLYSAAGRPIVIAAGPALQRNTAASGGGIAVESTAKLSFSNELTENTATAFGGGLYASGSSAAVTAYGRITANTAHTGGGAAVLSGSSLTLAGATVNNNLLSGTGGFGAGVYNDGLLKLAANGSVQPTVSYNDVIYLAQDRTLQTDERYHISAAQNKGNRLTLDSASTANHTHIIEAATPDQAAALLASDLINHLNGNLSQLRTDTATNILEINSVLITYWTDVPNAAGAVSSTFTEEPGATNVSTYSFQAAGLDSFGDPIDGFVLPSGKLLTHWLLARPTDDGFTYLDSSYSACSKENAKQYFPGDLLELNHGDFYLIAEYDSAAFSVIYQEYGLGNYLDGTQGNSPSNVNHMGSLYIDGATFNSTQRRYSFNMYTDGLNNAMTIRPAPRNDSKLGLLQALKVYRQVDWETFHAAPAEHRHSYTLLNVTYYWVEEFTADVGADTGKITSVSVPSSSSIYGSANGAVINSEKTGVTYHQPAANLLIRTTFKQTMVKLEMGTDYVGYFDTHHAAFSHMMTHAVAGQSNTITLLAAHTTTGAESGTKGVVYLNGVDGNGDPAEVGPLASPASGTVTYRLDLNGYTLDMSNVQTMLLNSMDAYVFDGVLRSHASGVPALQIGVGNFSVENVRLTAPDASYGVSVSPGALLHIRSNCELGKVFLAEGATDAEDAVAAVEGNFTAAKGVTVATFYLDGEVPSSADEHWMYNTGERVVFQTVNVSTAKGDEIRACFKLGDANAAVTDHSSHWFIGTDGRLYKKVKTVEPTLACASDGTDHASLLSENTAFVSPTWNENDYPVYHEYSSQYGFDNSSHQLVIKASLLDACGDVIEELDSGFVRFLVNTFNGSTSTRLFGSNANLDGGTASVVYSDASSLNVSADRPYMINTSWYGNGEYDARYADYWNYNHSTSGTEYSGKYGVNGSVINGVAHLNVDPKPISDPSIDLVRISPASAQYIGPKGAELGYTSVPQLGTIRDEATDHLLRSGTDYVAYYVALTRDPALAVNADEILHYNGADHWYLKGENGDKIYYSPTGSGARDGTSLDNARSLNGADVGLYSVELQAVSANYTGLSGWKEMIFEITPYTGQLIVSAQNHVVAKNASTPEEFQAAIQTLFTASGNEPVITDYYGNAVDLESCAIDLDKVSASASLHNGWPAAEGLYNLVVTAEGHDQGSLQLTDSSRKDPNYAASSIGYTALLVTTTHLNIFVIPNTVSVPYSGQIYTDSMVKVFDEDEDSSSHYEVWTAEVDDNGRPIAEDGSTLDPSDPVQLQRIKTCPSARRLETSEYRLELGTPQHIPRDADRYTMIVTNTAGKYRGLGYLNITAASILSVEAAPASAVYTGQNHLPAISVTDSQGHILTANTDYTFTIWDSASSTLVAAPVSAGTYTYVATGINNYAASITPPSVSYTVLPKQLDNSDVSAGLTDLSVTLDAVTDVIATGAPIVPNFRLYYNGMVLTPGVDYDTSYTASSIIHPGTYTVRITGKGNYIAEISYDLKVHAPADTGTLRASSSGTYIYHAGDFASYGWLNHTSIYKGETLLSANEFDAALFKDMDCSMPVSYDAVLDAGSYFIRLTPKAESMASLGLTEDDYAIGILHIERCPVTVTLADITKVYGQTDPSLSVEDHVRYTTSLTGQAGLGAHGFYARDSVSGSFSREPGEDVRNIGYHFSQGTFSAGSNYVITVSSKGRLLISSKNIADSDVIVAWNPALSYTGYGQSPITSVTYQAPLGNFSLSPGGNYVTDYETWVPEECPVHHEAPETCSLECQDAWKALGATPSDVGWYRVTLDAHHISGAVNNYEGHRENLVFQITSTAGMLDVSVAGEDTVTYRRTGYSPNVDVLANGFNLSLSNYKLTYRAALADGREIVNDFDPGVTQFTEAGIYTIYATGLGNYTGSVGETIFTILPKDLAEDDTSNGTQAVIIDPISGSFTYNGNPQTVDVSASYNGSPLARTTDYTLSHQNHTNAGTASVTIQGRGNFTGSRTLTYTIAPKALTVTVLLENGTVPTKEYGTPMPSYKYELRDSENRVLDGIPLTGAVVLTGFTENVGVYSFDIGTLSAGSNYSLSLAADQTLRITKKMINSGTGPASQISVTVPSVVTIGTTPAEITAAVTYWASIGTTHLMRGTDFSVQCYRSDDTPVSDDAPLEEGDYYLKISAVSTNYSGEIKQAFSAVNADSYLLVSASPAEARYNGPDGTLIALTAKLGGTEVTDTTVFAVSGPHGSVVLSNDGKSFTAVSAGTYVVTARGTTSNGEKPTFGTTSIQVHQKNIGDITVASPTLPSQPYTGSDVSIPNSVLEGLLVHGKKDGQDYKLIPGTDFVTTYSSNVAPGTATMVLYGRGNFSGSQTFTFGIDETRYRLIYNANGGSGEVPVDERLYLVNDSAIALSGTSLTNGASVVFYGWSPSHLDHAVTSADDLDSLRFYRVGTPITITDSLTPAAGNTIDLFAVWAVDANRNGIADLIEGKYTVTYQPGAFSTGTPPVDNSTYAEKASVTLKHSDGFTREGYVLFGWTKQAAELTLQNSAQYLSNLSNIMINGTSFTMGTSNVTLYPVWGIDSNQNGTPDWEESSTAFYVYYDGNGGIGSVQPALLETGSITVTTLAASPFSRPGYVQVGWTTNLDGAAQPGIVTSEPADGTVITIDGKQHHFCGFGKAYHFTEAHANPIIFYALWAEDANSNRIADYKDDRYQIQYQNQNSSVTASIPSASSPYLTGLPVTLAGAPTGTYTEGTEVYDAVFLGWTNDTTVAGKLYARGEAIATSHPIYTAGERIAAPHGIDVSAPTNVTFYSLWGKADYNAQASLSVSLPISSVVYNGAEQIPSLTVTDLALAVDPANYTVTYTRNGVSVAAPVDAGVYLVTVTGRADTKYAGISAAVYFTVTPAELTLRPLATQKVYGAVEPTLTFEADNRPPVGAEPVFSGSLTRAPGENAGSYDFILSTLQETSGNYTLRLGTPSSFTISKKDISDVVISPIPDQSYTGSAIEPVLTVVYPTGDHTLTLVKDTDYAVVWKDNQNTGTATATLTGKGPNYTGTHTVTFNIVSIGGALRMTPEFVRTYTGLGHRLPHTTLNVTLGTKALEETEYEVTYQALSGGAALYDGLPQNAGTYLVKVAGQGGYEGLSTQGTLIIQPAEIQSVTHTNTSLTYNKGPQAPTITSVTAGSVSLLPTDYITTYRDSNNVTSDSQPMAAGDYTMVITGKGNFTGHAEVPFTIHSAGMSVRTVAPIVYDAAPHYPVPVILDAMDAPLVENRDYTLTYLTDCTNVGLHSIQVTGIGNYAGQQETVSFAISPKNLGNDQDSSGTITITVSDVTYTGSPVTPDVLVTYTTQSGSILYLQKDTDYKVTFADNLNVGEGTATIAGLHNYAGSVETKFTIRSTASQSLSVSVDPASKAYTGEELTPTITVTSGIKTLTPGTDYTVAYSASDNGRVSGNGLPVNAGVYSITVTGQGNYAGFVGSGTFLITPVHMTSAEVSGSFVYNGSPHTPDPVVTFNGRRLTAGTDYTLSYSNNVNAGTSASVTVTGKGNYTGSLNAPFTIRPFTLTAGNIYASLLDDVVYTGQAQLGKPTVTCTDTGALTEGVDYDLTYHGDTTNVTSTDIQVSVHGKGNYDGTVSNVTAYQITPALIQDSWIEISPSTVSYSGRAQTPSVIVTNESRVRLVEGTGKDYTLAYSDNTSVGTATVTVTGTGNYKGTAEAKFTIAGNKTSLTMNNPFVKAYTGSEITLTHDELGVVYQDLEVPAENYDVRYIQGDAEVTPRAAGTYVVVVEHKASDATVSGSLVITPKDINSVTSVTVETQTYDGLAKTPEPVIMDGSCELVKNTDYTLTYSDNVDAGTAIVTIIGKGNYDGSLSKTFSINAVSITDPSIAVEALTGHTYDGTAYLPDPVITFGDTVLSRGADYTLSYRKGSSQISSPTDAGSYKLVINGIGNFSGTREMDFTIAPRPIQTCRLTLIPGQMDYTGNELEPSVVITYNTIRLEKGSDFDVSYSNNVEVSVADATVTVAGKGNFSGTATATFPIVSSGNVLTMADVITKTYSGTVFTLDSNDLAVKFRGRPLDLGDYDVTYSPTSGSGAQLENGAPLTAGTYTITIEYNGSRASGTLVVSPASFTVSEISAVTFNGSPIKPVPTVKHGSRTLTEGTDYTVFYTDNVAAGENTASVVVTGRGNYAGHTVSQTFTISPKDIGDETNVIIAGIPDQSYTGSAITPTLSVTYRAGESTLTLISGTDYSAEYNSNVNTGEATVTLTGKDNYTGSRTLHFNIVSAGNILTMNTSIRKTYTADAVLLSETDLNVRFNGSTLSADQYDVAFAGTTLVENTPRNAGIYTITVTGKNNYAGLAAQATLIIDPAAISIVNCAPTSMTYNGEAQAPVIAANGVTSVNDLPVPSSDYTVTYRNNSTGVVSTSRPISVGSYTMIVTGQNNFTGTVETSFQINATTAQKLTVEAVAHKVYDGAVYQPKPQVTDGGRVLTEGADYLLSYQGDRVNAGTHSVTAAGIGNYTDKSGSADIVIEAKDLKDDQPDSGSIEIAVSSASYTGSQITPHVLITYTTESGNTLCLTQGVDYTLTYGTNVNVGTGSVTVRGMGNYTGSVERTFPILPAGNKSLAVSIDSAEHVYNGSAHTPTVTVMADGTELTLNTDYTVSYSNNINAGIATVSIIGKGTYANFSGTATFAIVPARFSVDDLSPVTYTGTPWEPSITVKFGGTTLEEDTHYTVEYHNNVNAGTAIATVTGTGNFTGTVSKTFQIQPLALDGGWVSGIPLSMTYTGSPLIPAVTVTRDGAVLAESTDYTVTCTENVTVGTATVTCTGKGNYTGTVTQCFGVLPATIQNDWLIVAPDSMTYTGQELTPAVIVTNTTGTRLVYDIDYDVDYVDNVNINSSSSVTVTGKGNYTGSGVQAFTITEPTSLLTMTGLFAETYDGASVNLEHQALNVRYNGEPVAEGDYTVSYEPYAPAARALGSAPGLPKDAGVYTVTVTHPASGTSVSGTLVIHAVNIDSSFITVDEIPAQDFTGSAIENVIISETTLHNGTYDLMENQDYRLSYTNNVNAGTAAVTIIGTGNYAGSRSIAFQIRPAALESTDSIPAHTYNGTPYLPTPTVRSGSSTLVAGRDYTLSYHKQGGGAVDAPTEAGDYVAVITGIGNYLGASTELAFTIDRREITSNDVSVTPSRFDYTGSEIHPTVIVRVGTTYLVKDQDHTVTYTPPTALGDYTVTVQGIGNYYGRVEKNFQVISPSSGLAMNTLVTKTYTGSAVTLNQGDLEVCFNNNPLNDGDYQVEYSGGTPVNAGAYTVTVTYQEASIVGTLVITPAAFTVEDLAEQDYTGSALHPVPVVRFAGVPLANDGTSYTLSYRNNTAIGTGSVVITGKGNFAGCIVTKTFTITGTSTLFRVTYDGNGSTGGTVPTDGASYLSGSTVTVLGGVPTKSGATFLGWVPTSRPGSLVSTASEANTYRTVYEAGNTFTLSGSTTLYALWAVDANHNQVPDYQERLTITASAGAGGTISPSGTTVLAMGGTQSFTIAPQKGYTFSALSVDGVKVTPTDNGDGTYHYTFSSVTANHTIVATFLKREVIEVGGGGGTGGGNIEIPIEPEPNPRPEWRPGGPVLKTDEHYAYVQGTEVGFSPDAPITRAQVATILSRLITGTMEIPGGYTSKFLDVSPEAWYYDGIAYLEQFGIIQGVGNGCYEPDRPITRAEFAAVMMRFFVQEERELNPIFTDLSSNHWAYDYINQAHAYGFVQGYTDGTFCPDQNIRRAEAVTIVNRVLAREADRQFIRDHQKELTKLYPDVPITHWAFYYIVEASLDHDFYYEGGEEFWESFKVSGK